MSDRQERVVSGFTHSSGELERCAAELEDLVSVLGSDLDALSASHASRTRQAVECVRASVQHQDHHHGLDRRVLELEDALAEERRASMVIKQAAAKEAAEHFARLEALRVSSSEGLQSERQRLGSCLEGLTAEVRIY